MSRYRKAWVAVAGALAQVAVVLDQALADGTLPPAWVPWVRVALAALTAVGVYAVPNAPRTLYVRARDTGSARPGLLGALLAFAAAGLLIVTAVLAGPAEAHRRVEHVGVTSARVCSSTLVVGFGLERLQAGAWGFLQDDGHAVVQLHHLGAAAGPGGRWVAYPDRTTSGGEGSLRVAVGSLPYWDAVRVVHAGVASSPRLPEWGCAA